MLHIRHRPNRLALAANPRPKRAMSQSAKGMSSPRTALAPLDYALYAISVVVWGLAWIAMHYVEGPGK